MKIGQLGYLAAPYSHPDAAVVDERMKIICDVDAALMRKGIMTASPLLKHYVAMGRSIPTDWAYWKDYALAMLSRCDFMVVIKMPGWEESVGLKEEMKFANDHKIPVIVVTPEEPFREGLPFNRSMSMWQVVVDFSDRIKDNRVESDILTHTMTEMGELAQEVQIFQGKSYKRPGKDGIVGEAVDLIICGMDMIRRHAPTVTEKELIDITWNKCFKWERTVNPKEHEPGKGWTDYGV